MRRSTLISLVLIATGAIICWYWWVEYLVPAWAEFLNTPAFNFELGLFSLAIIAIPFLFGWFLIMLGIIWYFLDTSKEDEKMIEAVDEIVKANSERKGTFCENCGNTLNPKAKFCGGCGTARS